MKKFSLLLLLFFCVGLLNKSKAQSYLNAYRENTWHFGFGPDVAGVINPSGTQSRLGVGAQLHLFYYPTPNVGLGVNTGYLAVLGKTINKVKQDNYQLIPFTISAKAFMSESIYVGTDVGIGHVSPKQNATSMTKIVAPSIGYNDNDSGWDVSLRYQVNHQHNGYLSMISLHLAYYIDLTRGY